MGTNTYRDHRQKYEYKKALGNKKYSELSGNKENIFDFKGTNTYRDHRQKYEYKKALGNKKYSELSGNKENIFDFKGLYSNTCNQASYVAKTKKTVTTELNVKEIDKYFLYSAPKNGFLSPEIGIFEHEYLHNEPVSVNSFEELCFIDNDSEITVAEENVDTNKKKYDINIEDIYKTNNESDSLNISNKAHFEVKDSKLEIKSIVVGAEGNTTNFPYEVEEYGTCIDLEIGSSENTLKIYHEGRLELGQDLENDKEAIVYQNTVPGVNLSIKAQLDISVNDVIKFMEADLEGFAIESY
ncbi:hypothetical protein AYI69_g3084 [Smittium culicis]|uniref:Uncharacterized protein n=1 Tax=Smittium culicis TaxID=133412 RepID=A0A1R1YKP8_9FUNG|nr:hypothetical protein AYI69_g3084 [Smittium culicis]